MGRAGRDTPLRALQDVVLGILSEASERYAALIWFGFSWDEDVDAASLEGTVDFSPA